MRHRWMRYAIGALALATVAGLGAPPIMQSGAATTPKTVAVVAKTSATTCGQIPFKLPPDPSGVLKTLPQSVLQNYNNYLPMSAITSPWMNFKTTMPKGGFVIGYSNSYSGNYWRADLLSELNHDFAIAKKAGLVSKFIVADSNLNNAVQIQQVRSMIEQHVNLILAIPNSSTAMNGVFQQAYKAGIPVVTIDAPTTSPYTVDVDNQNWMTGALAGSGLVKEMGYKGNVIMVDGLAGAPGSVLLHNGAASVRRRDNRPIRAEGTGIRGRMPPRRSISTQWRPPCNAELVFEVALLGDMPACLLPGPRKAHCDSQARPVLHVDDDPGAVAQFQLVRVQLFRGTGGGLRQYCRGAGVFSAK